MDNASRTEGGLFPSLEEVIDGMVSHERDPRDLADLEREWANEHEVSLAAAQTGDNARLKALAEFANYHADLLGTLGLTDTAVAGFLAEKKQKLHLDHPELQNV